MVRGHRRQVHADRRGNQVLRLRPGVRHQAEAPVFELLKSQGMAANQQVTFLTDGGTDVRELPLYLNPQAEHLIDWFHITMRLTVMNQIARALEDKVGAEASRQLERLTWFLWHGNVFCALQVVGDLEIDLDVDDAGPGRRKLVKAIARFGRYLEANTEWIPNYRERYRSGEAISNAFVESAVNQVVSKRMVKKQHLRWSQRGAHLLLQIRTRVLNDDLAGDFRSCYPAFMPASERQDVAA